MDKIELKTVPVYKRIFAEGDNLMAELMDGTVKKIGKL